MDKGAIRCTNRYACIEGENEVCSVVTGRVRLAEARALCRDSVSLYIGLDWYKTKQTKE
jgi:hypothetical protein